MNVVQVTWSFNAAAGGSAMAIRDLQAALGGGIISFGDATADSTTSDFTAAPPAGGPLRRAYGVPSPDALASARSRLATADLVITHLLYRHHVQWATHACRELRIPYWMVLHGALDPAGRAQRRLAKRAWLALVGAPALRRAARVLLATEGERRKASRWLRRTPAAVVPWPVDPPPPIDRGGARRDVRARLRIPEGAFVLLYLGRLDPIKQPEETIRAAALGDGAGADVHLLMVGPDSGRLAAEDCRRVARDMGYTRLHLPGAVYGEDRWAFFAAADAFVTLSRQENFGYALVEALAFGLPAIASPGIDLAAEPVPGMRVARAATAPAVAALVRELAALPAEERARRGAAAAAWAHERFARDRFTQTVRRLASDTVAGRAATPAAIEVS